MLVLKICTSSWENASRDKRELEVCEELGCSTAVLAKGNPSDRGREEYVDGFKVFRFSTRPLGNKFPNLINRVVSLYSWARFTRKTVKPDIISGHDISGLFIGWLSNWFKLKKDKAKLIYDSHEFELGRNTKRSRFSIFFIKQLEKILINKSEFSIMVNESIAAEVQNIYKLEKRPLVIRSIPNRWTINPTKTSEIRKDFFDNMPQNVTILIMFHGGLGVGNGIETLIPILAAHSEVGLVLLGKKVSLDFYRNVEELALRYGVLDKIYYHEAVSIDELVNYVSAVDIEVMLVDPITLSYYYTLPNKLFESIQAETPILASSLPEMKRIIDIYHVGEYCEPGDSKAAIELLEMMLIDERYVQYKSNLQKAKEVLCWENEKEILKQAYKMIM